MLSLSDFYGGVSGTGSLEWVISSSSYTTQHGIGTMLDTSGGTKTVTLHALPNVGDTIAIADLKGTFDQFPVTVSRNSMLIQGGVQDLTLDVKNQRITLVWSGATDGWIITKLEPAAVATYTAERKNLIINGNFDIWQRAASQPTSGYGSADRWYFVWWGCTGSAAKTSFATGDSSVPSSPRHLVTHSVTSVTGSTNYSMFFHRVENIRQFSGKTVTLSFYARSLSTPLDMVVEISPTYGTGGTPSAPDLLPAQKLSLTTGFKLYTFTVDIPQLSGKTLGTDGNDCLRINFWFDAGSAYDYRTDTLGHQSGTWQISQVQLEFGSVATSYERRSVGEELVLCQRYYQKGSFHIRGYQVANGYLGHTLYPFVPLRTTAVLTTAFAENNNNNITTFGAGLLNTGLRVLAQATATGEVNVSVAWEADAEL